MDLVMYFLWMLTLKGSRGPKQAFGVFEHTPITSIIFFFLESLVKLDICETFQIEYFLLNFDEY